MSTALAVSWSQVAGVVLAGITIYLVTVALIRIFGQRALARFSIYDLPVAVAMGAMIGRVALTATPLLAGAIGLLVLFLAHSGIRSLRTHGALGTVLDTRPVLIMHDGQPLEDNLRRMKMSRADLREQLRLAGVARPDQVRAVIMERSGTHSVIVGEEPVHPQLLLGVEGVDDTATEDRR